MLPANMFTSAADRKFLLQKSCSATMHDASCEQIEMWIMICCMRCSGNRKCIVSNDNIHNTLLTKFIWSWCYISVTEMHKLCWIPLLLLVAYIIILAEWAKLFNRMHRSWITKYNVIKYCWRLKFYMLLTCFHWEIFN